MCNDKHTTDKYDTHRTLHTVFTMCNKFSTKFKHHSPHTKLHHQPFRIFSTSISHFSTDNMQPRQFCKNLSIVSHCLADCAPFTMSHKFNYTQQAPSPTLPHAPHFQQLIGHKKQQTVTLTKEAVNWQPMLRILWPNHDVTQFQPAQCMLPQACLTCSQLFSLKKLNKRSRTIRLVVWCLSLSCSNGNRPFEWQSLRPNRTKQRNTDWIVVFDEICWVIVTFLWFCDFEVEEFDFSKYWLTGPPIW